MPVDAHQIAAAVGLFDLRVDLAGFFPLRFEQNLRALGDTGNQHDRHGNSDECDQREHRRDDEHHGEDADDRQHRGQQRRQSLGQGRRDVVDVVGDAAENFTARRPVEVRQRKSVNLRFDLRTQLVDRFLHDDVEQERFHPGEQRRHHVHTDGDEDDLADGVEVQPDARDDVGRVLNQVGERRITGCTNGFRGLVTADAGRQTLADESGEDEVGDVTEDLGYRDGQRDTADRREHHDEYRDLVRLQQAQQPFHRGFELLGFGRGCGGRGLRRRGIGLGLVAGWRFDRRWSGLLRIVLGWTVQGLTVLRRRFGRRRCVRLRGDLGKYDGRSVVEILTIARTEIWALRNGHALISAGIWEATISWYVGQLARRN